MKIVAVVANPEFKNLQVLPKDLTRDQLMTIVRSFTQALGVRCNECHVVTATEPREQLDFASDAKRVKAAKGDVEELQAPETEVFCWTCHRGNKEPEKPAAPARRAS